MAERPEVPELPEVPAEREIPDAQEHFEAKYAADDDPWDYTSSWYERRKYGLTLAVLPRERYRHAWEPACSIGELSTLLAGRVSRLDASDISPTAVGRARERLGGHDGVRIDVARLPAEPPGSGYDLLVLSEVLYYLSPEDREATLRIAERAAAREADLVVVSWRHHPEDAYDSGAAVNAEVSRRPGWNHVMHYEEADFVIDVLTRGGAEADARAGAESGR